LPPEINKEVLDNHLIKLVKMATLADTYVKGIQRDLNLEVTKITFHGEIQIKNMQMDKFESISKNFDLMKFL